MIDTHVHLNDDKLKQDLKSLIHNAQLKGVREMIVIGVDYKTSLIAIEIASQFEGIYASVGLHPSEVDQENDENLDWVRSLLLSEKVVAIGEAGLDFYWTTANKERQIKFFNLQIEIAKQASLPLIVHSRESIELTYQCLKGKGVKGVVHCYSGSFEMAERYIREGFYLGIGGVITYKNAQLRNVVKKIELNNLLTETDAPYLTPVPFRGKTNKPEYITIIVEEIARLKNVAIETVRNITVDNAHNLFNIKKRGEK